MNTREIQEITASRGLHPNKKLGQNFLCNDAIVERILAHARVSAEDTVLEIGPGLGAVTGGLCRAARAVYAVEIDAGLARYLKERFEAEPKLTVIHDDFLKHPPVPGVTKAVGNLPYYCSTEILFRLAEEYRTPEIFVMLQREMADRIRALPGSKSYGAVSVTLGALYEAEALFKIEKTAFYPQPEVSSSFLALTRRKEPLVRDTHVETFRALVKAAFWGRRKTLATALSGSPHLSMEKAAAAALIREMGLDEKVRGEDCSPRDFARMAELVAQRT
ncbi:MAG: ribosomal RNA small subunit methyltransferase A [Spirochaetes bacterium]|nr:MAG: ribosomal RNA small subunit methyltransferase A [Spirochaetota bacterium]